MILVSLTKLVLFIVSILNGCSSKVNKRSNHLHHQTNLLETRHFSKITTKYFSHCDLYLTTDNDDASESRDLIDDLSSPSFQASSSRFILHLDTYFQQNKNWNENCSTISCFSTSTRKYSQCSLVVGLFTQGESQLEAFDKLLISPFKAPIKNEQDHFIFIVGGRSAELGAVLRNSYLSTIKFKIGISMTLIENEHVIAKTLCIFCNKGSGLVISIDLPQVYSLEDVFPDFSRNGDGNALRVSGPPKYAFLYELEEADGEWVSKRGVYKFFIEALVTHYNFTFTVFPSTGHGSGTQLSNGTWNGVVGDVLYGLADFGTSTSPNPARFQLISYTTAMIYPFVSFIVGPPKITYSWKAIYWPFTVDLWLSISVSLIFVVVVFKLFKRVKRGTEDLLLYRHLVGYLSFTLIGQGLEYPKENSARIILAVWLFAAMIFNTLYVSKIVGLLAFPIYSTQPRTFKELVESDLTWGFDKSGGNLFAHFKSSSNPVFHTIFERKEPEKEAVDCFNTAIKSEFACVTWAGVANYVAYKNLTLSHGKSPLVFADDITLFVTCGIAFPRRTLHRDNFDNIIGTLRDSGQVDKWIVEDLENLRRDKVHWQQQMNMTVDDISSDSGPDLLSLSNLLGVFYFYFVGHVAAVLLMGIEILRKRRAFEILLPFYYKVCPYF